jgi:hypothetical protein
MNVPRPILKLEDMLLKEDVSSELNVLKVARSSDKEPDTSNRKYISSGKFLADWTETLKLTGIPGLSPIVTSLGLTKLLSSI